MKEPEGKIRHSLKKIFKRESEHPVIKVVQAVEKEDAELKAFEKISRVALQAETLQAAYPEILEEIIRLTSFPYIFIEKYDEARKVMVLEATRGIDLTLVEGPLEVPAYESLSGLACRIGQVMIESRETSRPRYIAPALAGLNVRTMVCVPMMVGKKSLGTLSLASPIDFKPGKHLLSLATTLANTLAIFSERIYAESELKQVKETSRMLYESERKQRVLAQVLQEAGTVLSSSLDLDLVLDSILVQLEQVVAFDNASVFLLDWASPAAAVKSNGIDTAPLQLETIDGDGQVKSAAPLKPKSPSGARRGLVRSAGDKLKLVAGKGYPISANLTGLIYPAEDALFQEMYQSGRPVVLADAEKDARWQAWGGITNVHGWVGAPLAARGEIIGCLVIDSCLLGVYDDSAAALVKAFANQAAIAIDNARLFSQVERLAITDTLTGLYNRRYFFEFATQEFERSRRYGRSLSVMMLDIDHFKKVNDTYGHLVGDRLLTELAEKCKETLREAEVMARYGGEEFVILLPETTLNLAFQAAERLWQAIASLQVDVEGQPVSISVSLGVAELESSCATLEALLERADQALYQAKAAGRGQIVKWSATESG
ncbi:MAG: sensor domain-containing diguanylate cyclase [Anaerolineaceae bacterium]|nr:sensor domain-containing diguanylate cyclase [Anaerolineaceae bacterium]